ncbi:hypothetical protein [Brevundimonas aurifodinae]|uniref:Uncharacterized protein n=1 Tax=Brevundimonas aurifodinae TaxID=1508312 RepID=A0ABV1NNC9_9CAUL
MNLPFTLLLRRFGYNDVLREPPLDVLAAVRGPDDRRMAGQTLLASWALAMGLAPVLKPLSQGVWTRALGLLALVLSPLCLTGETELLAAVDPALPDFQISSGFSSPGFWSWAWAFSERTFRWRTDAAAAEPQRPPS